MVNKLIQTALAEVGYLEKKSNSQLDSKTANAGRNNFTKYARDLDAIPNFYNGGKQGVYWCDVFVDWCFVQAFGVETAKKLLGQPDKSLGAGCVFSRRYFGAMGQLYKKPKPGDVIFFSDSSGDAGHTGIVRKVDSKKVYTVEGNTSGASGVVDNGGGVWEKSYSLSEPRILDYGRPDYDSILHEGSDETKEPIPATAKKGDFTMEMRVLKNGCKGDDVRALQILLIGNGFTCGSWGADGNFGNATEMAVKNYQKAKRLQVDGKAGPETMRSLLGVS